MSKKFHNNLQEKLKSDRRERRHNILYLILGYLKEQFYNETAQMLIKEANLDDDLYQLCENVELDIILQEFQSFYYTKFQKYPKIVRKIDNINRKPKINFQQQEDDNEELINEIKQTETSLDVGSVKWSDCLGLDNYIETLKEATIYPIQYPELFGDIHWQGVLLHGPPGTGKTLLARALACESGSNFFNVTISTFTSKFRGESEKLLNQLFTEAKLIAPSVVFFDEIDSLMAQDAIHEATKRFKAELLTLLDGVVPCHDRVVIVASTNSPWDIDRALLRRFDKRIFVDLPNDETRQKMLLKNLKFPYEFTQKELEEFAKLTNNYSGSDIKNLSKEIGMSVVRQQIKQITKGNQSKLRETPVKFPDIKLALNKIKPSLNEDQTKKYIHWQNEFGAI